MIELSASVSKKVLVPDVEFSSRCYSAGMEIEVACDTPENAIKEKLQALYRLLEDSINGQIGVENAQMPTSTSTDKPEKNGANGHDVSDAIRRATTSGNGQKAGNKGNGRHATQAQVKAIYAIAHSGGHSEEDVGRICKESFGEKDPAQLSIGQASQLIDALKGEHAGGNGG